MFKINQKLISNFIILALIFIANFMQAQNNIAPIAVNDTFFTTQNNNILMFPLNNDFDSNAGDQLSFTVINNTTIGTTSLQVNNSMLYLIDNCNIGTDQFTYQVCDDGSPILCDQATVTIFINPTPLPQAISDTFNVLFDDTILLDVLQNDNPFQYQNLTAIPINQPANSNLFFNNGLLNFEPNLNNINNLYFFNYASCDDCFNCDTASVIINITGFAINIAPNAANDFAQTNEDFGVSISPINNDVDVNNDNLIVSQILQNANNGNAIIGNSNQTVIYTPNNNFNGLDSIVYQICENTANPLCNEAIIYIDVLPINDAPIANNDLATVIQANIAGINPTLNDVDLENNNLVNLSIVQNPTNGNATLINADSIAYIPNYNFLGFDSLIYQICDDGIPQECNTATIYFNVIIGFVPPTANNDFAAGLEENILILSPANNDVNLLTADTLITVLTNPIFGSLTQNTINFNYQPNTNFFGLDSFQYQICNVFATQTLCDTAWAILSIVNINDLPIANNDIAQTVENQNIIIDVLQNDSQVDNDSLIVNVLNVNNGSANVSNDILVYFPQNNFNGIDTITYTICDFGFINSCDTAMVFVTVIAANLTPIANNDNNTLNEDAENVILNVSANDSLLNITTATFNIVTNAANGFAFFDVNNNIIYTPNSNFFGLDSIIYQVCFNSIFCDTAIAYLNILNANDAPNAMSDFLVIQNNVTTTVNVLNNDSDIENNDLTISITENAQNGQATIINNEIEYNPNLYFDGIDTIYYEVCDNGIPPLCDTSFLTIEVLPTNNISPTAVNDTIYICDGQANSVNILDNDFDLDDDKLTFIIGSNALNGSFSSDSTGLVTYFPYDIYFTGFDSVSYTILDGFAQATAKIIIIYNNNTIAQTAKKDSLQILNNETINILQNDEIGNFDELDVQIINNDANLSINLNTNNSLTVTSNNQTINQFSFYYLLCEQGITNNFCNNFCDTAQVVLFINYFSIENIFNDIPNVITPNNDGKNEYFQINGLQSFPSNEISIFNRWGQLVFNENNYKNNWNGVYKNTTISLKEGTYYYSLTIVDNTNESHIKNGSIQILK